MLLYLKSECYRTFHRKYLYGFGGVCVLLIFAFVLLSFFANQHAFDLSHWLRAEDMLEMLPVILPTLGLYSVLLTEDIAFSDEYKHQTFKNTVSFGIPRGTVYVGKLLTAIFYSVLVLGVVLISFLGFSVLFLGIADRAAFREGLHTLSRVLLGAFPLWVAALSLANALFFAMRSNVGAVFSHFGIFLVLPSVLELLGHIAHPVFHKLNALLLTSRVNELTVGMLSTAQIGTCWLTGMIGITLFSLAGYAIFRRKGIQ